MSQSIARALQRSHRIFNTRAFHASSIRNASDFSPSSTPTQQPGPSTSSQPAQSTPQSRSPVPTPSDTLRSIARSAQSTSLNSPALAVSPNEPYHLNVFSHRHNLHITFTEPSRAVILSYSSGNIGVRKAQRGSFDASYQLSSYVFRKMAEKAWRIGGGKAKGEAGVGERLLSLRDPSVRDRGIEIILRGYGQGRDAFQKAMLGTEGKLIRGLIKRISDGTRLKFGGTRSPALKRR